MKAIFTLFFVMMFCSIASAQGGLASRIRVATANPPTESCKVSKGDVIQKAGIIYVCGPLDNTWTPQAYYYNQTIGLLNPIGVITGNGTPSDGTTAVGKFASRLNSSLWTLCSSNSDASCVLITQQSDAGIGLNGPCGSRYCVWSTTTGNGVATFPAATSANRLVYVDVITGGAVSSPVACDATDKSSLIGKHIVGCVTTTNTAGGDYNIELAQGIDIVSTSITYFQTQSVARTFSVGGPTVANSARFWPVYFPSAWSASRVFYDVQSVDNTANTYDIGVYNCTSSGAYNGGGTGTLVWHTGSTAGTTFSPTTDDKTLPVSGGPITGLAGWYVVAVGHGTGTPTLIMGGDNGSTYLLPFSSAGIGDVTITYSSGLPSTITCPVATWGKAQQIWFGFYQ